MAKDVEPAGSLPSPRPPRRALVVEDNPAMRALIEGAVASLGFEVHACGSSREAIRAFPAFDPDLLIADIDLGARPSGVELAHILRAQAPYLAVVFLTHYPAPTAIPRTVGMPERCGFVNKSALTSLGDLSASIEAALDEDLPPTVVAATEEDNPLVVLTPAQLDVLALIAAGCTNAEIASRRSSSTRATERMVVRIFEALGLNDDPAHNPRVRAAMLYARHAGIPARIEAH